MLKQNRKMAHSKMSDFRIWGEIMEDKLFRHKFLLLDFPVYISIERMEEEPKRPLAFSAPFSIIHALTVQLYLWAWW